MFQFAASDPMFYYGVYYVAYMSSKPRTLWHRVSASTSSGNQFPSPSNIFSHYLISSAVIFQPSEHSIFINSYREIAGEPSLLECPNIDRAFEMWFLLIPQTGRQLTKSFRKIFKSSSFTVSLQFSRYLENLTSFCMF